MFTELDSSFRAHIAVFHLVYVCNTVELQQETGVCSYFSIGYVPFSVNRFCYTKLSHLPHISAGIVFFQSVERVCNQNNVINFF